MISINTATINFNSFWLLYGTKCLFYTDGFLTARLMKVDIKSLKRSSFHFGPEVQNLTCECFWMDEKKYKQTLL